MKKEIGLLVVGAMVLGATGTAFAAEAATDAPGQLQASGAFEYQYRDNQDKNFNSASYSNRFDVGINLSWRIDASTTFFGRVAGETGEFGTTSPTNPNDFKMDNFGVKTTMGGWQASIGRQGTQLGQGGIFSDGDWHDPMSYFDGIVLTNKLGGVNLTAIAGNTTSTVLTAGGSDPAQRWVGLDLNKDFTKNVNIGMAFANRKVDSNGTGDATAEPNLGVAYSSLYGTLKSGAMTYTAEYIKSNAATENNAYDVSACYQINGKNSVTAQYFNVKQNSTDWDNSAIGAEYNPDGVNFTDGYKGLYLNYRHSFTKTMSLGLDFYSLKPMYNAVGTDSEFAADLKWKF